MALARQLPRLDLPMMKLLIGNFVMILWLYVVVVDDVVVAVALAMARQLPRVWFDLCNYHR